MSAGLIVAIIVIIALIVLVFAVAMPRARARARERELVRRRDEVATAHRAHAEDREARAEYAEQQAARERAEADLHESRARLHERGLADDELDAERERLGATNTDGDERFAREPAAERDPTPRSATKSAAEPRHAPDTGGRQCTGPQCCGGVPRVSRGMPPKTQREREAGSDRTSWTACRSRSTTAPSHPQDDRRGAGAFRARAPRPSAGAAPSAAADPRASAPYAAAQELSAPAHPSGALVTSPRGRCTWARMGDPDVPLPDGRRLRVRCWPGRGRPLVLLHGLLDDPRAGTGSRATRGGRASRSTCRASAARTCPTRPRISAYADDVIAGLRAARRGLRCTLVGHSLGGAVAAAVAERTDGVGGLALLAPAGSGRSRLAEAFSLPGVVDLAELALPFALVSPLTVTAAYATFVAHGRMPSRDLTARLRRRAFRAAPGVRAAIQARSPRPGAPARLRAVARSGSTGPSPRSGASATRSSRLAHLQALRRALPQAHVEVWAGMGHHPQRERPAAARRASSSCRPRTRVRSAAARRCCGRA